jgi:hypothetical protein
MIVKCHNKECIYNIGLGEGKCEREQSVTLSNRGICTDALKKQKDQTRDWRPIEGYRQK